MDIHQDKILILDFGSQFTQLIARRIRELNVYCEIHPGDATIDFVQAFKAKGIILSGGPNSVYEQDSIFFDTEILKRKLPILGICYGMQLIASKLGGEVISSDAREFGHAKLHLEPSFFFNSNLFNLKEEEVWMSHGDKVIGLPPGFKVIASSLNCEIAAFENEEKLIFGMQFHPEVTHTKSGVNFLKRFIFDICQIIPSWFMEEYEKLMIQKIRQTVGKHKVILALSGGVDSSVAGVLIHRAIKEQLICIFVDTGLLRLHEADNVMLNYQAHLQLNIIRVNAQDRFYHNLANITDPEEKRKIIGRLFIEIFEEEAKKIPEAKFLAQGTIYPDVIESAGTKNSKSHSIKSHHNVGGLPEDLNLTLLEPLRELFKDEVRRLGIALGINPQLIYRHPFPGPGLGVRILGEVKKKYIHLIQKADFIFIEELKHSGYYNKVAQAFVVFIPVKTVGVMGDGRTYDYLVSLRAVETTDFMTANVANLPFELITRVANRIINEVTGINRVVYDISGKPPATIEWE